MNITGFTIKVILDKRYIAEDGRHPVKIRITKNRRQYYLNTRCRITQEEWDSEIIKGDIKPQIDFVWYLIKSIKWFDIDVIKRKFSLRNFDIPDKIAIENELVLRKMPDEFIYKKPVVYFLCIDDSIQYIGKTTHLLMRLSQHMNVKMFNSVLYIECDEERLDRTEREMIKKYNPPLNISKPRIKENPTDEECYHAMIKAYNK